MARFGSCRRYVVAVYDGAVFIFIRYGRYGFDNLYLAVPAHAGAGGNQLADNNVFLQAEQGINLALDSRIRQYAGRFLERRSRQERFRRQRGFRNTEQHRLADSRLAACSLNTAVRVFENIDVDVIARQHIGVTGVFNLHLAEHLTHDNFDVFVVDTNALGFIYLLHFVYEVALRSFYTQNAKDVVRIDGTRRNTAALRDDVAFMND